MTRRASFALLVAVMGLIAYLALTRGIERRGGLPTTGTAPPSATPKSAPTSESVASADGSIMTVRPSGAGWSSTERTREEDGVRIVEVHWRRPAEAGELHLFASVYDADRVTIDAICNRNWSAQYRSLLPKVTAISVDRNRFRGFAACDVVAEGLTPAGESLRVVERFVPTGKRVVVVSAAGSPAALSAARDEVLAWYAGVQFTALE